MSNEKCDILILRTGKVLMLLNIKNELLEFCKKYNTIPLFAHDFGVDVDFNRDSNFNIESIKEVIKQRININGCVGFKVTTYGEACKIYQNINELSIFNGKLDAKIRGHDDIKHFMLKNSEYDITYDIMYVKLYPI